MKRKGFIAEGDVAMLLRRYESSTILSLLYEISKCGSAKLNWAALVKDSNTGIRSPREYQALWRHLAYRTELEPVDVDDVSLEDDGSDLEFELEAFPSVTADTANEASNYAKALMGFPTDVVAAHSEAVAHAERKKRKLWTMEEDQELAAGVEKYGEGNWAVILKNVFKHDRTASQLAQRWSLIKKRREPVSVPSQSSPVPAKPLDAESIGSLRRQHSIEAAPAPKTDTKVHAPKQGSGLRTENLSRIKPAFPAIPRNNMGSTATRTIPVPSHIRPSSGLGPDPMVQAAAVAAGARIAPASTAATLLKSKNVVHVRPSNPTNSASTSSKNTGNPNNSNSNTPSRPGTSQPVIHYIRTGTGAPPPMLSSLSKRPLKQGTPAAVAAVVGKNTMVNVSAASTSKSVVPAPLKPCSSNTAGSRLAIRNSKDGTIQEIMETSNKSKKKIIVARESNGLVRVSSNHQHVSSWYEVVEEPTVAAASNKPADSEENEDHGGGGSVAAAASAMVTSSNESGLGLVTASPLSHSSVPSD